MEEERRKSGEVMATKIMEKEIYMLDTKSDDALVNECREMKKDFYVYNSMTSKKELFKPKVPGKVGMYLCGITPSDYSHVGHARVAVAFDILYRYLHHLGYNVIYVRNFTDVDDKTLQDCEVATAPFRARILKEGTESNVETAQITLDAQSCINGLHGEFETKMSDDLQTPPILSGAILKSVKFMNKTLNNLKFVQKKHKQLHLSLIHSLIKIEEAMREVLDILGLLSP